MRFLARPEPDRLEDPLIDRVLTLHEPVDPVRANIIVMERERFFLAQI